MYRTLCGLALVLLVFEHDASANDRWIGEQVMPTRDATAQLRGHEITIQSIKWPAIVTSFEHDTIWIGNVAMNVNHLIRLADAEDFYTELIKQRPTEIWAYDMRGATRSQMGDNEGAIADLDEAIRLNPKSPYSYINRALVWFKMKEYDSALIDCTKAIELDNTIARAFQGRSAVWGIQKEYKLAKRDLDTVVKLDPVCADGYVNRAIFLASCPESELRDGKQAIRDAAAGCELTQWANARAIDALAMSYAEAGDFQNAIRWQQEVCTKFTTEIDDDAAVRLSMYKERRPYRWQPTTGSKN